MFRRRHQTSPTITASLAILLAVASTGCAAATAGPSRPPTAAMSQQVDGAKQVDQQRLIAMLRSIRVTGDTYDRMTEARSTILDAVSWWATITVRPPAPATSSAAARPGTDAQEIAAPCRAADQERADPYAEIDAAPPGQPR
ncbi:MAG: hypothetical protein JRI23_05550 [Deltaproteobacteria bacterium]|jgi:hypothetical protein|nr:hypothetical protein [Deltaproteobacteria bacterium]MBW2531018.1 hypothetical protein [Deltaproteobacteria bacterium]